MIKTNYSIKCFVKEPSEDLKKTIIELIENFGFIIDKGWENGCHIHLRGALENEKIKQLIVELNKGTSNSITDYDEELYIKKYTRVAKQIGKDDTALKPIIKSKVLIENEPFIFESELEDSLFKKINYIFDSYFCNLYFEKNSVYEIITAVLGFCKQLAMFEKKDSRDSYNCHLSHYVAFIYKLNEKDKMKIEQTFQKKFDKDYEKGMFNKELSQSQLSTNLIAFFYDIRELVRNDELNFYMPYNDQILKRKLVGASNAHKATFSSENTSYFEKNEIVIANRWVTNALYKKMLLLGLSNLDRFYLNYVISRYAYSEEEIKRLVNS